MKFFVWEHDVPKCRDVIELIRRLGHEVGVVKRDDQRDGSAQAVTLVPVLKLDRCGKTPAFVRHVTPLEAGRLGGRIPPWGSPVIVAVAPSDFEAFDPPIRREVRNNALRQLDTALLAIRREHPHFFTGA